MLIFLHHHIKTILSTAPHQATVKANPQVTIQSYNKPLIINHPNATSIDIFIFCAVV